jgi:flavodoxin I
MMGWHPSGETLPVEGRSGVDLSFADAMGTIAEAFVQRGGRIVGHWPSEGYEYIASRAETEKPEMLVGLGIDVDNQEELTDQRITDWLALLETAT